MTALDARIRREITQRGPMRLDRFWNLALFDREGGYYARRDPFGAGGDFVTAPDVSQMFGELVGAWLATAWRALGSPEPFVLAEIGPGRATLMTDVLRTLRQIEPAMLRAARIRLVERSDRLAAVQLERLSPLDLPIVRHRELRELDALPLLIVANELFDAVAIRRIRFDGEHWRESVVALAPDDTLALIDGAPVAPPRALAALPAATPGDVFEFSPERDALASQLGERIAVHGGALLVFDYGHLAPGFGDTLQALRGHRFASVLESVGESDITSHVDFARLAAVLRAFGAGEVATLTQGEFLLSLGLRERAGTLGRDGSEEAQARIVAEARRLAGTAEGEMGSLFKVCCAASSRIGLPFLGGSGLGSR